MLICLSGYKFSGKDSCANFLVEKCGFTRISFADPLKDLVASEYDIPRAWLDDPNFKEKPLLERPVEPKDKFTETVAEFMIKEFRSAEGFAPNGFKYWNGDFYGTFTVLEANGEIFVQSRDQGRDVREGIHKVYHTPRSLAILKGSTNRVVASNFWVQKAINRIKNLDDECKLQVISDLRYKSEIAQLKEAFGDEVVFIRINRFKESPSQDPSERDLDQYLFDYVVDNSKTKEYAFGQLEGILRLIEK